MLLTDLKIMNYLTKKEKYISNKFLLKGYYINKSNKFSSLYIDKLFQKILKKILNSKKKVNLNLLHKKVNYNDLNNFRLELIYYLNKDKAFKYNYFNLAREELYTLAGNELMMQKNINISIQFPGDKSSLLPIHSDVWSGDSAYEINLWVPMVKCYRTKSMYILKPKFKDKFYGLMKNKKYKSSKKIFELSKPFLEWIKIDKNHFLLFNQSLPHGNVVNLENETRVTMNCRFKTLFSPYGDKKIGEFFFPITKRTISDIGDDYKYPFKL